MKERLRARLGVTPRIELVAAGELRARNSRPNA